MRNLLFNTMYGILMLGVITLFIVKDNIKGRQSDNEL
tara:strand:- start:369 stop:479 length:111 start_codon:yes stop_codon:yes gene_type:complete